jgi:hypothetical protein
MLFTATENSCLPLKKRRVRQDLTNLLSSPTGSAVSTDSQSSTGTLMQENNDLEIEPESQEEPQSPSLISQNEEDDDDTQMCAY